MTSSYSDDIKNYNGPLNNYLMYCNKPKWDIIESSYDYTFYKLTEFLTIKKYKLEKREKGSWTSFCKKIEFYKQTAICTKDYKFTNKLTENELVRLYVYDKEKYYNMLKSDTEELTLNFEKGILVSEIFGDETSGNLIKTQVCRKHN